MKRKKANTVLTNVGIIRNNQHEDVPTKTYVHAGIQDGRNVVYLIQYLISDTEYYGWKTVKTYKGNHLQRSKIIIRYETFSAINDMLSQYIYNKIHDHVNNTNGGHARG